MATWKQIEARRETRLWIKEIIVPTIMAGAIVWNVPEVREAVTIKAKQVKESVKKKFKKES